MTWPTTQIITTNVDAGADSPAAARTQIKEVIDAINLLYGSGGTAALSFLQAGTGAASRLLQTKLREQVHVRDYGAVGDGIANDTVAVQAAITYVTSLTQTLLEQSGAITDVYTGTLPVLNFGNGRYKITAALTCPAYFRVRGDNAAIVQATAATDIFYCNTAYQWDIRGVNFVSGRNQISVGNGNVDGTIYNINECEFHLSSDYAVKTFVTGGTYTHLSANLTIHKCHFSRPRKILDNCCDSAIIEDTWAMVDKTNFDASSAAIKNSGASNHSRLFLKNFFGVPSMGTQGVDRLAGVRWIDNYGSVIATGCRFGGELAGMAIVNHYIAPPVVTPFIGYEVTLRDCWLYSGPSVASDSGVILLEGQMPQRISITDCIGPASVPFIVNISNLITSSYFSTYETATSTKAYNKFQIRIQNNSTDNPDGSVYAARIPDALRPYLVGAKQTRVSKATQSLANAFANNLVSFDTVVSDNVGAFAIANPTRLVMPAGASKMRITANVRVAVDGAAKLIGVEVFTSGLAQIGGVIEQRAINADSDGFCISVDVEGAAGTYWHLNVRQNAAAALNLISCAVSLTPLDFVG